MPTKIEQKTRVGRNSVTNINSTYPVKKVTIKGLPRGSVVNVNNQFKKVSLKKRMSEIRSSSKFKLGKAEAKRMYLNKKKISTS